MVPLGPGPGHPAAHQTHGGPSTNLSGPNSLTQGSQQSNKSSAAVSVHICCNFTPLRQAPHVYVTSTSMPRTCDLPLTRFRFSEAELYAQIYTCWSHEGRIVGEVQS